MALYVIACAAENSSAVEVAREELDHATIKPRRHVDYEGARRGERRAGGTAKFAGWAALAPEFSDITVLDRLARPCIGSTALRDWDQSCHFRRPRFGQHGRLS